MVMRSSVFNIALNATNSKIAVLHYERLTECKQPSLSRFSEERDGQRDRDRDED